MECCKKLGHYTKIELYIQFQSILVGLIRFRLPHDLRISLVLPCDGAFISVKPTKLSFYWITYLSVINSIAFVWQIQFINDAEIKLRDSFARHSSKLLCFQSVVCLVPLIISYAIFISQTSKFPSRVNIVLNI